MKKVLSSLAVMLIFTQTAFADSIAVRLNNAPIKFDNTQPTIVNGRTLVPLRGVFDAMGYDISWDAETKTATLISGHTVIEATTSGLSKIGIDGAVDITGDTPPKIIDGSFMIPIRAVSEASGAEVSWDDETRTVSIKADIKGKLYAEQEQSEPQQDDEEENIEGRMTVDEKEYIGYIKQYTDEIKAFTLRTSDEALSDALGISVDEEKLSKKTDYSEVKEILNKLTALQAPDAMYEVQECVEEFVADIREIINSDNPIKKAEEMQTELKAVSNERFSVKLYNYFKDNAVNWEKVYGETVLDALKIN